MYHLFKYDWTNMEKRRQPDAWLNFLGEEKMAPRMEFKKKRERGRERKNSIKTEQPLNRWKAVPSKPLPPLSR